MMNKYKGKYPTAIKKLRKERKALEKYLDTLWSKLVKKNGKCELCCQKADNAHHIFSRKYKRIRWNLDNGISLCFKHHFMAHHDSTEFKPLIIKLRGQDWYDRLKLKRYSKGGKIDLKLIKLFLETQT